MKRKIDFKDTNINWKLKDNKKPIIFEDDIIKTLALVAGLIAIGNFSGFAKEIGLILIGAGFGILWFIMLNKKDLKNEKKN